jgi:hypothetical protein
MPFKLPDKPLGLGSSRAQKFEPSKLDYRKEIENASTSINRVISEKTSGPSTSVSRIGSSFSSPVTSVAHIGQQAVSSDPNEQTREAALDKNRYKHLREVIAEREKKQKEEALSAGKTPLDIDVKTGSGFRTKGKYGMFRTLSKLKKASPTTFSGISRGDMKYFSNLIKPHAQITKRGEEIGSIARRKMKLQIEKDRQSGKLSRSDSKAFKTMINKLSD